MKLSEITVYNCIVNRSYYPYSDTPQKYLFIDFDGTVRKAVDNSNPKPGYAETYSSRPPFNVNEVKVFKKVIPKLLEWRDNDYRIVGVTNQSGVQEGAMSLEDCVDICQETLKQLKIKFPVIIAPLKTGNNKEVVNLRKPSTGMINMTEKVFGPIDRENSLLVGDYKTDIETGKNANIFTFKVDSKKEGSDFPLPM